MLSKWRLFSPRFGFALVVGLLTAPLCRGQGEQNSDLLNNILQACRSRQKISENIWVRFRFRDVQSAEYMKRISRNANAKELILAGQGEFAQKGTKVRSWARRENRSDQYWDEHDWLGESFIVYNGEISIRPSSQDKIFMISRAYDKKVAAERPTSIMGEELMFSELEAWASGKGKISDIRVLADKTYADEVVALQWKYPQGQATVKAWFVPSQGWILRRYEEGVSYCKSSRFHEATEYIEHEGLYYPKKGLNKLFMEDGQLQGSTEFEVESLETRASHIPDSLFQYEIPKDAQVWDNDLKVMVRNTELTESHLAELIRRLGPPPSLWVRWSLSVIAVTGFVILAARTLRRVRNRWLSRPSP